MTTLVFGQTGQVARELALLPSMRCLSRAEADLTAPDACAALIADLRPGAVINAAAYTAVDRAEEEEALATVINAAAPAAMARACGALGVPFVSLSTDYVFDGSGTQARTPADTPAPLGAYGRSKLAGEQAIAQAGGAWAILRTSWVFSAQGSNFVRTMLRLGREREHLRIVADQIGGPTPARDIACACARIAAALRADPGLGGLYHLAGAPAVSWATFAREIFAEAGLDCDVEDIASSDYPTPARRPLNSRLDCGSLTETFGIGPADWRSGLRAVLDNLERSDTS